MNTSSALAGWANFYVIIGGSAGALIGLQFVVMTLIADTQKASTREIDAFSTPTVIHFLAVLVLSLIASAPWPAIGFVRVLVGVCGYSGLAYIVIVTRRVHKQSGYQPVAEDWIWHTVLPFAGYLTLAIASATMHVSQTGALFATAGAALLLLFVGIHNAWDTVTYIVVTPPKADG